MSFTDGFVSAMAGTPGPVGPACGVLFVVALAASFFISSTPDTKKSPAYILAWYNKSSHKTQLIISTILADVAIVLGLFFFGYLRDRWGRTDIGSRLAPILFVGGAIFAAGGAIFGGATVALLDQPKHMTPETAPDPELPPERHRDHRRLYRAVDRDVGGWDDHPQDEDPTGVVGVGGLCAGRGVAGRACRVLCVPGVRDLVPIVAVIMWRREETRPVLEAA